MTNSFDQQLIYKFNKVKNTALFMREFDLQYKVNYVTISHN
jgi:hypothetical protein